jgi:ATP-dependent Zn protease
MGDKQPLPLSPEERECLACHETGHAIVLLSVAGDRLKPVFLTTERYGQALGHMYPVEAIQWQIGKTESMIEAAICISMAGMAAEKVFMRERHNSGGGDMPAIRFLLNQMAFNGMLEKWPEEGEEKELKHAISKKREELWLRTQRILSANKVAHSALVAALMKSKELTEDEIMEVVDGLIVTWDDIRRGVVAAGTLLPVREKEPQRAPAGTLIESMEPVEDEAFDVSGD